MNPQAETHNNTIKKTNPVIFDLLSKHGKNAFFPNSGIVAQTWEAAGKKFNATIGLALEEDGSPMHLPSIASQITLPPIDVFPYARPFGKPELREIWKKKIQEKNPSLKTGISMPIVTCALTHALNIAAYLFLDEGDYLIIADKFWGNYKLVFQDAYGVKFRQYALFKGKGFDIESFEKTLATGKGKKVVSLNFPNNPTGYTVTEEEAKKIISIIKKQAGKGDKLVIIIDDAYFGLVYKKGVFKESLFAQLAGLHENVLAIKVDGATKEDYAWGLRIGFLTYGCKKNSKEMYEALENKTVGGVRASISNPSNLSQSLLVKAYTSKTYAKEKKEKHKILQERFDEVESVLSDGKYKKHFEQLPCNSGYFICVKIKGIEAEQVRKLLLKKYNTGTISMGDMIRVAFSSLRKQNIKPLFENIYAACEDLKK